MPARSTGERSREPRHEPKVGDQKRGEEEEEKKEEEASQRKGEEEEEARGKVRRSRRSVRAGEKGILGREERRCKVIN